MRVLAALVVSLLVGTAYPWSAKSMDGSVEYRIYCTSPGGIQIPHIELVFDSAQHQDLAWHIGRTTPVPIIMHGRVEGEWGSPQTYHTEWFVKWDDSEPGKIIFHRPMLSTWAIEPMVRRDTVGVMVGYALNANKIRATLPLADNWEDLEALPCVQNALDDLKAPWGSP